MMRVVGGLLLGVLLFSTTAEVAVRILDPTPRLQVVRSGEGRHQLEMLHGEPVWAEPGTAERIQEDCTAPRRAVMLGSSILYGTGFGPEHSVGRAAQRVLDAEDPGAWCVHNLAQAGFTSEGKLALATSWIPKVEPGVVIWELWTNDPGGFTMIGEDAYNVSGIATDDAGYPVAPVPVPAALHHALFGLSRAWWYATLALPTRPKGSTQAGWQALIDDTLPAVESLVRAQGAELVILAVPELDQPFATSADDPYWAYLDVRKWAEARGHTYIDLADRLRAEDHLELRLDTCCHYNIDGQARVGAEIASILVDTDD